MSAPRNSTPTWSQGSQHWLVLGLILSLGLVLRLWRLASKPLWVDEIITSIFGLGRNFDQFPADKALPLTAVPDLFTLKADVGCGAIASHLASQSTHPPLFFCLLHSWLVTIAPWTDNFAWQVRSLSVVWGVAAIAALYLLNRLAFSPTAGLVGAGVMALSPFAVYLSQEARHYTLPITLITLGLACQVKLHQQLLAKRSRLWLWALWSLCHCVALYSHYFCALAIAAQWLTLLLFCWCFQIDGWLRRCAKGAIAYTIPLLVFIPWLPTFWQHFNSPKTGWLSTPDGINPLIQTLAGWAVMMVSLPVERQTLMVQLVAGLLTLVALGWLIKVAIAGSKRLPRSSGRFTLVAFLLFTVLEFLAVIYLLQKDISIAPRYHFVYFPAVCALLGAFLSCAPQQWRSLMLTGLILGISSLCVVYNLAFQKPYAPALVAERFNAEPAPVAIMMAYHNTLEMAVGLSYGLALAQIRETPGDLLMVRFTDEFGGIWQTLETLPVQPEYLWAIAPGYFDDSFPTSVRLKGGQICELEPEQFFRLGFPYQRYWCGRIP
ncbi:MAG: hypothetical protein F6J87_10190 [Spirulina sp. SIO3F2]|nr:hypothetical protein [Spirulina sp. SIO3F2]